MKKFLSVLLAVMMVLSTVSFAVPSAMGTFVTVEQEIPAAVETPEAEAELAAKITDNTPHGELIYELNFDNLANGTAIADRTMLSELGATLSAKYESANNLFILLSGYENAVVENGALKAEKTTTSGRWPQIQVSGGNKKSFVDNGIIYMEADMKFVLADEETTNLSLGLTGYREYTDGVNDANGSAHQTSVQTIYTPAEDTWHSLSGAYALNDEDGVNGMECIIFLTSYDAASTVEGNYFYLDNLRLYYKPFEADVTVKCGSQTVTKTYSTTEAVSAAELASLFDLDILEAAAGVVVDGVEYSAGDDIYFTEDTTAEVVIEMVDPKYYDAEYGLQLFNFDFEAATIGDQIPDNDTTPISLTDAYKTPFTDKLFAHPAENWKIMANTGKTYVMADPKNPDNKVLGTENITDGGYPVIRVDSWVDYHKSNIWGFVESEEGYYTVVYDVMDTKGELDFTERFGGMTVNKPNAGGWLDEAEDQAAEYRNAKVAGEYRTNVTKYGPEKLSNLASTKEVSFVKIHSKAPNANSYYIDNFRLYWKPLTADITVSANGMDDVTISNPTLTGLDTQGMTVSALLEQAGVDYSEVSDLSYVFKGVSLAPEGGKVYGLNDTIGFVGDGTVYLIFEEVDMTDWIDEDGIVVMEMDFENVPDGTIASRATISSFGGRVNPYFANSDKWAIDLSGVSNPAVVVNDAEKGNVLEFTYTTTGSQAWPQFLFGYLDNDKGLDTIIKDNGTFVISVDFKADFETAANYNGISIATNGYKNGAHQGPGNIMTFTGLFTSNGTLVDNTWYSLEGANGPANAGIDGPTKFTLVLEHGAGNTAGTVTTFHIDNLKVCWKPDTVDVTVNGGKNTAFETVTLEDVSTTATIDEVIAMIPGATAEYGKITGLADMDGNKLTSFGAASNVEYQAVWTPWTVMEGGADFAVDSKTGWSNATGGWTLHQGGVADIGDGGGDITTAGRWNYGNGIETKNGNLYKYVKTPKMGDAENGTLTTPTPWSLPAVRSIAGAGELREEIYVTLPAGNDAEYVLIKYQYHNIPDLAQVVADCTNPDGYKYSLSADGLTISYKDRNGEDATASLKPAYGAKYYVKRPSGNFTYGGGEEFHKNEVMVEGEWYYDFLPVEGTIKEEGATRVLCQHANLFDGMVVEYDYIHFVKLGVEDEPIKPELPEPPAPSIDAPESLKDETDIRMKDEDAGNNGIRFKASVTSVARADADALGWLIMSYDNFMKDNASRPYTDLTAALVGVENVKIAYNKGETVEGGFKGFMENADKEMLITSVVLRNIPEDNYNSYIIARPFAVKDGEYVYGQAFSTSMYLLANALYNDAAYDDLSADQQTYIEDIVWYVEDNLL